jgi:hypothetical protein
LDFAVADAGSAHADTAGGAGDQRANALQIDIPAALGNVVGVADFIAELGPSTANFANSCHFKKLLIQTG